jgi:hypothetical protein
MSFNNSRLHFLEQARDLSDIGKTGVSLHCHTLFSKEALDFIPYYAAKIPIVSNIWERECRRYHEREGRPPNFTTGYWEPPLTGHAVFEMETEQMGRLGLEGVVSITDHDSVQANLDLNLDIDNSRAPISMEWTVPYGCAYFHLGIHNLPAGRAETIAQSLVDYTFSSESPDNDQLHEIFALLNDMPEVLIVMNHPVWDIEMIGQARHEALMEMFVADHAKWLHAIEVNGFRPWSENTAAIELAERLGLPLISGGDRHCLHSNTMINVTGARSFSEFAAEIREDKLSNIVVMPEYREPLASRQIKSMAQILGHYPEFPKGRQQWFDRVYFNAEDETGVRSLASHWGGTCPAWHRWAISLLSVLGHRSLHPFFRLAVSRADIAPVESKTQSPPVMIGGGRLTLDH